jgi:hypothetical protein
MPITRTPMIDDDGSGTTGTILNNAWKQELYGQIDAFVAPWVDIPAASATFTTTDGAVTWTVPPASVLTLGYSKHSGHVFLVFAFDVSTISAPVAGLQLGLPTMPPSRRRTDNLFATYVGDGVGWGLAEIQAGTNVLVLSRGIGGPPWAAGSQYLMGQIAWPI